jgi:signal transduction histidine kinase
VQRVVWSWIVGAAVAVAGGLVMGPVLASDADLDPALAIGLAVATVLLSLTHVRVVVRGTVESTDLSEVGFVPLMILLPPHVAVIAGAAVAVCSELWLRRDDPYKTAFNVSWVVVATALGSITYWAFGGGTFAADAVTLTAGGAAALVHVATNQVAFSGILASINGRPWRTTIREEAPSSLLVSSGTAVTGVLVAVLVSRAPLALPLLLLPTLLHTNRLRARSEGYRQLAVERSRFERTVEGTSDGVVLVDGSGRIAVWNAGMAAMTGVPTDAAVGSRLDRLGWDHLETGSGRHRVERDGRTLEVHVDVATVTGGDADTVISVRDISREAELERIRDDLVSRISHEMRTPLTTVTGFLEILQARWTDLDEGGRRKLVRNAHRGAERLSSLVTNLMVWSRIEQRQHQPEAGALCVVGPVVTAALRAHPDVVNDVLVGPDTAVSMTAHDLTSVLRNLVDNAVVYGAAPITVSVAEVGGLVRLTVEDHGEGLPSGYEERAFEPFAQASEGLRRTAKGLGIGLAIVHELATAAGGEVLYERTAAGTTRFVVTLARSPGRPDVTQLRRRPALTGMFDPSDSVPA